MPGTGALGGVWLEELLENIRHTGVFHDEYRGGVAAGEGPEESASGFCKFDGDTLALEVTHGGVR